MMAKTLQRARLRAASGRPQDQKDDPVPGKLPSTQTEPPRKAPKAPKPRKVEKRRRGRKA